MSFLDKIRLLVPVKHSQRIGDSTFAFYQCSPRRLAATANLVATLAGSVAVLMADTSGEAGHVIQDFEDPETGEKGTTTQMNPVSVEMAAHRVKRQQDAIQALVKSAMVDDNRRALIELIVDSLRDEFPRGNGAPSEVIEEFDNMDLGNFSQFFIGMMKANATVFGDLGKVVVDRVMAVAPVAADQPSDATETPETVG
jgi:hypothetical protein